LAPSRGVVLPLLGVVLPEGGVMEGGNITCKRGTRVGGGG
jgi:hypothetical protein